jgi:hypothetical protein
LLFRPRTHRSLPSLVALLATLAVTAAMLTLASSALARSHKRVCAGSAHATVHARRAAHTHACTQTASGRSKHRTKHHAASHTPRKAGNPVGPPAACEDGSAPQSAGSGAFSCQDGSEPECEAGVSPVPTRNGARLVCPVPPAEEEAPEAGEGECEEGFGLSCGADSAVGSNERTCLSVPGPGTGFVCEDPS